ncbi:MAG: Cys-Cys-COOH (seleno)protein SaoC [Syntrophomonadaceae bacterium]|jgi:hypothetical protein
MLRKKSMVLVLSTLLLIAGCGGAGQTTATEKTDPTQEVIPTVDKHHVLYKYFQTAYGDKKPILTGVNDINDDGREDLIVIYRDTSKTNKMIAIWEENGEVVMSDPTPAPVEKCRIEWRDIDNKAPIELIIAGSKGVNFGYAIYRWENGNFVNLFGEGMEDCC